MSASAEKHSDLIEDIGLPTSWGLKCLRCGAEKLLRVCDATMREGVCHDCYDTLKASAGLSEAEPQQQHQDNPYHHVAPNGAEIGATLRSTLLSEWSEAVKFCHLPTANVDYRRVVACGQRLASYIKETTK